MTIYLIILAILGISSFFELIHVKCNKKSKNFIYFLACALMFFVVAFRYGLESDYWHYYNVFNGVTNPTALEIGFRLFNATVRLFTQDYVIYCILVALISFVPKTIIFSKYKYPFIVLLTYYLRFYVLFDLNAIRQGIAITFVVIAIFNLSNDNKKNYFIFTLLATMFHASTAFSLVAYFLKNKNIKFKNVIWAYVACLMFRFFLFEPVLMSFSKYIPAVLSSTNNLIHGTQYIINSWDKILEIDYLSLARVIIPGMCLFFISKEDEENRFFFNLYFVGSIINIVFWGLNTISFRVPAIFYVFEGIMLNNALLKNRLFGKKKSDIIFTICFIGIAFCDIWTFISYLNESLTLVPYKTVFGRFW